MYILKQTPSLNNHCEIYIKHHQFPNFPNIAVFSDYNGKWPNVCYYFISLQHGMPSTNATEACFDYVVLMLYSAVSFPRAYLCPDDF